jgi:adenosylcobinamide-phosphate synthase
MRGAIVTAVAVDMAFGEPPSSLHPTVGMGRMISASRVRRSSTLPRQSFVEGTATVAIGAVASAAAAIFIERLLDRTPRRVRPLLEGAALKPALSVRDLLRAAASVEQALERGRLRRARELLSWHLVSRDTSRLSAGGVAAAAIESLAENFNDGLIAPLWWYRAGGLPAAYVFRFVNTADAMIGYRTDDLEWFGKTAARLDDLLAFVPARVSATLIAVAAHLAGESGPRALVRAVVDAANTSSPNAGWPMAAMAGALGVRLEKSDHYVLNSNARLPRAGDIRRARRSILRASGLAAFLAEAM